jgi:hypothetical protein
LVRANRLWKEHCEHHPGPHDSDARFLGAISEAESDLADAVSKLDQSAEVKAKRVSEGEKRNAEAERTIGAWVSQPKKEASCPS